MAFRRQTVHPLFLHGASGAWPRDQKIVTCENWCCRGTSAKTSVKMSKGRQLVGQTALYRPPVVARPLQNAASRDRS
ncbi:hypothetical protein BD310DRAFT_922155 [Dichomitus squalens]|uniref:Uncharacterized protein n=1 Tax=Dichomitus squalens TaxID=114155 RepID=A0A4V2K8P7_9APHY|nr:hypothetical protein BD310DRAFT_922155 [Dichomitus squalens]